MSVTELPYLHMQTTMTTTPTGLIEIKGIQHYQNACIRNRVICRLDILVGLNKYFSDDTLSKYREIVYSIISGNQHDKEKIAQIFKALYLDDEVFRRMLGEIVYFSNDLETVSLYLAVMRRLLKEYNQQKTKIYKAFENVKTKVLFESNGFVYIAPKDEFGAKAIPEGYKEEVVSSARVWQGDFTYIRSEV